ncbi:MAG: High-affinity zinc uptake system ATP-binding protein ZnuC [Bacteroidota bacterium]|nr:High-affinity zinc uptake system ATP-binding protein ZnuC [Bacteroidota bacterium]MDQ1331984.1 High-affinity zinc uptake system ATP-binding protein ZnuC [Bacteroidota bacterium]
MASLLEMNSLSVSYDANVVLQDINFSVRESDFIGVIGPNGGGKTTLLKVILGLIKPFKGNIVFNNELINANSIGYLPQISTGDVNYPVTVSDVILSGMMIRKKIISRMSSADKKRAKQVIDELGLSGMERTSLNELSGGQLQRVFLGRAVIGDPKLLLLDEPGNFVDSTFENDFYGKLKDLNKRMAILMVSHDIGMISSHVKSYACVNRELHYHPSSEITNDQLLAYGCPIQLITHGEVPHTVLKIHN